MKIKAWGPLFALIVLAGAGIAGLFVEHPEPHNRSQPTVAPNQNNRPAESAAQHTPNQHRDKGKQESNWIERLFDKPIDTLLVLFNGLLVAFTGLLYMATAGLFKETAELRRIANEQRADLLRSIAAAEISANAARAAAEIAKNAYIAEHRTWLKVYPTEVGPVTFVGDQIHVIVAIEAENIGESPALAVNLCCKPFRGRGFVVTGDAVKSLVAEEKGIRQFERIWKYIDAWRKN